MTPHYIIIDCDVIFTKKINMFENNKPYFTVGTEYHKPYFVHIKKIFPYLNKFNNTSGISHHMIFNINILKDIFYQSENIHKEKFWITFLKSIEPNNDDSCCSEYELYYNYVMHNYNNNYITRTLNWRNFTVGKDDYEINNSFDFIALHNYNNTDYIQYIENIIYDTKYINDITIKDLNLIKNIVIENGYAIKNKYKYGIAIPTYCRLECLKITLDTLSKSYLYDNDVIIILFDDGSDLITEKYICEFNIQNIPFIKLLSNRINLINRNSENTILSGSSYPFTIKFMYDILFRMNCKYVINVDSDSLISPSWIKTISETLNKINDKYFILTGFNSSDHKTLQILENYKINECFGGLNIIFNRDTFYDFMYDNIYDYKYDWIIKDILKNKNIKIYGTSYSIVQHIGFDSSIIRGIENIIKYNKTGNNNNLNCELETTTIKELLNLALTKKDFIHAPDYIHK